MALAGVVHVEHTLLISNDKVVEALEMATAGKEKSASVGAPVPVLLGRFVGYPTTQLGDCRF